MENGNRETRKGYDSGEAAINMFKCLTNNMNWETEKSSAITQQTVLCVAVKRKISHTFLYIVMPIMKREGKTQCFRVHIIKTKKYPLEIVTLMKIKLNEVNQHFMISDKQ